MLIEIIRGYSKDFTVSLKHKPTSSHICGEVYENMENADKIEVQFHSCTKIPFVISDEAVPASYASKIIKINNLSVTITSINVGSIGNSISLVFDGISTLQQIVNQHNTNNPSKQVSHNGSGQEIPAASTATLSGGHASYFNISRIDPQVLGKFYVRLTKEDTMKLAVGEEQDVRVIITGETPVPFERVFDIKDAISVRN